MNSIIEIMYTSKHIIVAFFVVSNLKQHDRRSEIENNINVFFFMDVSILDHYKKHYGYTKLAGERKNISEKKYSVLLGIADPMVRNSEFFIMVVDIVRYSVDRPT